ncbi:histidine phosphatase family protein [Alkalibaculum sp. M08DMB]|uniref:phosphoglycerate mutase (2,3-diphosphoglycerate-dependent) n=1 Tax=Alkalibaculum sporogenes TaxID=2655001 RepID=A0A6A7KBJ5_9FIRM|nr:histidine phosphatase family protein [Alkalibaculum sporogenes]MPW26929.1 histidine phosphatase family protein [Alkalibaculum sporogenes]
MKFTLVRHVETTGNYENRFAGVTETLYTQKGKEQFIKLTNALKEYKVDNIYSSPISRALNIANKIGEYTNTEVKVIDVLSEMNFGIFENLTFEEVVRDHNEHWLGWESDYLNYQIPEGDSLKLFHQRISDFLDTIKNEDGTCMIVCHGGTIQSIVTHLLNLQVLDRWHFHIPLGGIVEISYKENFGMLNKLHSLV